MESGMLDIQALYEFAKNDPSGKALKRITSKGREYGDLVTQVTKSITQKKGVYLWGKYKPNKLWENIYIGQSGDGKNARLRWRIGDEELKKWNPLFWFPILGKTNLIEECKRHYPNAGPYWEKALLKVGATHIIWVTTPADLTNKDVEKVESDLIEAMNPTGNKKRPKPQNKWQQITMEIIGEFRRHIHENR